MAAVNTYILSSAYSKLHYIAVTGGVLCIGEVENKRCKLVFTARSFEVQLERIGEFFRVIKKVGENLVEEAKKKDRNSEGRNSEVFLSLKNDALASDDKKADFAFSEEASNAFKGEEKKNKK